MASFDHNYHNPVWVFFLFKFCIISGAKITITLISTSQAKLDGFWYLLSIAVIVQMSYWRIPQTKVTTATLEEQSLECLLFGVILLVLFLKGDVAVLRNSKRYPI